MLVTVLNRLPKYVSSKASFVSFVSFFSFWILFESFKILLISFQLFSYHKLLIVEKKSKEFWKTWKEFDLHLKQNIWLASPVCNLKSIISFTRILPTFYNSKYQNYQTSLVLLASLVFHQKACCKMDFSCLT